VVFSFFGKILLLFTLSILLIILSVDWLLTFNKSKCKHVHFGPPNNAKYQMGGDIITQSTEEKNLGTTIDETLKLKYITEHRNKLTSTLPKYQRLFVFN
jgi:hypothetical protein